MTIIVHFCKNLRKLSRVIMVEEGLNYNLVLKNLGRIEEEKTHEH